MSAENSAEPVLHLTQCPRRKRRTATLRRMVQETQLNSDELVLDATLKKNCDRGVALALLRFNKPAC
ncbi:MAG: hypothetical protein MUC48_26520 [Leptolyngbya sp. Prado105]|jgi:delta-aminolevulinic acid dehydratase/porphobilinogen synthase|nr:hypothetical protein [Leptolyngbya sp. Prado105]